MSITGLFRRIFNPQKQSNPRDAYDIWASGYDNQPGNLMLDLDEELTGRFLNDTDLSGKTVADIGCGTGRHWKKIFSKNPARLVGFDVSRGMLAQLKQKYPAAETHLLEGNQLQLPGNSCDLVLSTLTIAHIENIEEALAEWNRILKPGGEIFITENHPEALAKGGQRTFKHEGQLIAVKNHIHSFGKLRKIMGQLGWKEIRFTEKAIDESVRSYYEKQDALHVYEKFSGVHVIYGIHLKKTDDPA